MTTALTLEGHSDAVTAVDFSPDGRFIVSASNDKTVKIWDTNTGACVRTLTEHSDPVSAVHFSPNGRCIASGSWDVTIKVLDLQTGACVPISTDHSNWVSAFDFSPDGRFIASSGDDETVSLWDAHTGARVSTLDRHSDAVSAVRFSPDGRFIASGSHDKTVKVWDARTSACERILTGHSRVVSAVHFSPDGRFIASGSHDGKIKVWDAYSGACERTLTGHLSAVDEVHFSPDGRFIASGSHDKTVKVWDAHTGACVCTFTGHSGAVSAVQFSPDGRYIVSGSDDKRVKVWDAHTDTYVQNVPSRSNSVPAVRFSPDGPVIASGGSEKTAKMCDTHTRTYVRNVRGRSNSVPAVHFSPDGPIIASGGSDKAAKVWDSSDLKCGPEGTSGDADEEKCCKDYWEVVDSDRSGELDAQNALVFFSKARLPISVLYRMWDEIATARGKRALTYDDFVLALRWVALAQNGEEASLARVQQGSLSLHAKIDVPGWNRFDTVLRTPSETARHEEYWKMADADGSGEVDVQDAVAFLSKSGLRNRVLNEIWGLATSQGMFSSLDTERFKTALRLVAMAQKGMKLDVKEAAGGEMELIADFKIHAAKPAPEPMPEPVPEPVPEPAPEPVPEPAPEPVLESVSEPVSDPFRPSRIDRQGADLKNTLAETALDDLTCEQLARVLQEVFQVDEASVRNVRERKLNGDALHDMREFQELARLSFPDKKRVEKWVAGRKSYEGFEEYLFGVLGGDSERAERACALLLESHAVSNLDEWLWFRKQPSKRTNMRVIVRRFPELGTWPGGPEVEDWT